MKPTARPYIRIGVMLFLLYLAIQYWPSAAGLVSTVLSAAKPVFLGCAVAYLVNILMSFYERHWFPAAQVGWKKSSRRPVCMLGAMLTLVILVVLVIALVVPQLGSCFALIAERLPPLLEKAVRTLAQAEIIPADLTDKLAAVNWQEKLGEIAKTLASGLGSVVNVVVSTASSLISAVTTFVLALIFSIYLLSGKEKLGGQARRFLKHYLPERWYEKVMYVLGVLNDCFHKFIVGQCTEAVILGCLCTVGMLLFRFPYATMIGALVAFTALIPVIGAFLGGGIGAFLILMESPAKALFFLVFFIVLQQLEGNLIYPRVVGSSIGLPGIWVLAVVTVGGSVFGIPGILLGIPLTAALYRLIRADMNRPAAPTVKAAVPEETAAPEEAPAAPNEG